MARIAFALELGGELVADYGTGFTVPHVPHRISPMPAFRIGRPDLAARSVARIEEIVAAKKSAA